MKSVALGPSFGLGVVMPQMPWSVTSPARSIYLETLGCVISILPVHKEAIQGSSEGSNGTVTGVKISCGKCQLVNVLIADSCDSLANGGIKPFPNKLID